MKTDTITILNDSMLKNIVAQEPRFKQVLKGYTGEVVSVDISDKPMLLPHIPKIIDKVLFGWAAVCFGHRGNNPGEKVVFAEVSKCLAGKSYSLKKLSDAAEMLPNQADYYDYDSAQKVYC